MFGGIVETTGLIVSSQALSGCVTLQVKPQLLLDDLKVGDSISINGVCLTVTSHENSLFTVQIVPETLAKTNLGALTQGDEVNLERSLTLQSRIGGHYVQGHVDFTGEIISICADGPSSKLLELSYPASYQHYLVNKGYVTIDGMSITLIEVKKDVFSVMLIPHTQAVTIAKHYRQGMKVNIEVDILGKYVAKMLTGYHHD